MEGGFQGDHSVPRTTALSAEPAYRLLQAINLSSLVQQIPKLHGKATRQLVDDLDRGIAPAAFEVAYEGAMDI